MKLGKIPEACLKRSVLRQIKTRREEVLRGAGIGADCAFFAPGDSEACVVCVQEGAVAWRRDDLSESAGKRPADRSSLPGNTGEHSAGESAVPENAGGQSGAEFRGPEPVMTLGQLIQKSANNCAAGGAEPAAVMLALLLPEDAEEPEIRALMAEAEEKCAGLSLEIAGGQTRVTAAVTMPVATVTCLGKSLGGGGGAAHLSGVQPGQDVVVSKWIGLQGTALLARRFREKLLARYPAYLVEEAAGFDRYYSILPEAAAAVKSDVRAMRDLSEGGIFGALWELAESAGVGLTIDMKKLPIRQETVEVCECCGVNPYLLLSGGSLLMTAKDGTALVAALAAEGIPAAVIGRVTEGRQRLLVNGEETRCLDRPQRDEIWGT